MAAYMGGVKMSKNESVAMKAAQRNENGYRRGGSTVKAHNRENMAMANGGSALMAGQ